MQNELYKGQKSTQEPRKEKSRHPPCWRSSGCRAAWTETRGCYPRSTTLNPPTFSFQEEMRNPGWKKIKTLEDLGGTAKQEPKTDSFRHADSISERNWTESQFDSGSSSCSDFDSSQVKIRSDSRHSNSRTHVSNLKMFTILFDQICATFDCAPSNRKKWKAQNSVLSYSRPLTCFSRHEFLSANGVICCGQPGWLAQTTAVRNFNPDLERCKYSHVMPWPPVCIASNWIVIFKKYYFTAVLPGKWPTDARKWGNVSDRLLSCFSLIDCLIGWLGVWVTPSINQWINRTGIF